MWRRRWPAGCDLGRVTVYGRVELVPELGAAQAGMSVAFFVSAAAFFLTRGW
jgi:hypothetical protein